MNNTDKIFPHLESETIMQQYLIVKKATTRKFIRLTLSINITFVYFLIEYNATFLLVLKREEHISWVTRVYYDLLMHRISESIASLYGDLTTIPSEPLSTFMGHPIKEGELVYYDCNCNIKIYLPARPQVLTDMSLFTNRKGISCKCVL